MAQCQEQFDPRNAVHERVSRYGQAPATSFADAHASHDERTRDSPSVRLSQRPGSMHRVFISVLKMPIPLHQKEKNY